MTRISLPLQRRAAEFRSASFDAEDRSIEVIWTTGATVRRVDWWDGAYDEQLITEPSAVRLERLNDGAPFLNTHSMRDLGSVIGAVVPGSARIVRGSGVARVRLSATPEHASTVQNIADGIIRNISVGYRVHRVEKIEEDGKPPLVRVVDWEPFELSAVPIGADPGAHVRGTGSELFPCEVNDMQSNNAAGVPGGITTQPADVMAERARAAEINRLGDYAIRRQPEAITADFVRGFIDSGASIADFREAVLNRLAERDENGPQINSQVHTGGPGYDPRRSIEGALALRMGARLSDAEAAPARELLARSGGTLLGIGRAWLDLTTGERPGTQDRVVDSMLQTRAMLGLHSTSDFPALLSSAGRRVLLESYTAASSPLLQLARVMDLSDFRAIDLLKIGEAPALLEVNEHGEIQRGTLTAAKEALQLKTFARIVGLTRQAIVGDDLGAFSDRMRVIGRGAAETVASTVAALLTANAGLGATLDDGLTLFHATHSNLIAGDPALDVDGLSAGRLLMRQQTGLDGVTPISVPPRYLVVGSELETAAEQLLAEIYAATPADVNPFAGRLTLLVEPRLPGTAWYLFADPAVLPVMRIGYLNGQSEPQIQTRDGWDVLGVEFRAILDFGAAVSEHRGAVRSAGTGS